MEITDTMRLERFEAGSVIQKHLYASPEAGAALSAIATRYDIPEDKYLDFVTIFGDIVLGFYPTAALPQNLKNSPTLASFASAELISELQKILRPLIETETVDQPGPVTSSTQSDLTPKEQPLPTVSPVRTMEEDEKQIGYAAEKEELTYTTMQSAILEEGRKKDSLN